MKKLKIIIPSIALMVVLAFSLTIGVYAAQSSTFDIRSTVTFVSPDIDVIVNCYIGDEVKQTPDFTFTKDSIDPWTLTTENFSFVAEKGSDEVDDAVLTFVVINNTAMPIFTYFTQNGSENLIVEDTLNGNAKQNGEPINKNIINVALSDQQKIGAKQGNIAPSSTFKINFKLNKNLKMEDSASFNYSLVVSKESANLFNVGSESNYETSSGTILTLDENTIMAEANGYAGVYAFNTKQIAVGEYLASCETTGTRGNRILVRAYDQEGNLMTDALSIDGGTYLSTYLGFYFDCSSGENVNIVIPNTVAYWQIGFVFHGRVAEEVVISNIRLLAK